ncbi:unnamed protein product, partial [Ascophyllum nodosum]
RTALPQQAARLASSRSNNKKKKAPSLAASKPMHPIADALDRVKVAAKAKFDETVELAVVLNVDPRKSNQTVRGAVQLPKGTGKTVRVAVFAKGEDAAAATAAGADIVGGEDLLASVMEGNIDFDRCVATPDMMSIVGRAARVLGPRGLMPNAKVGSVTKDVEAGVRAAKGGQAQFRAGKNGVLHLGIGKVSFDRSDLVENVRAAMMAISNLKPEVIKGKYITQVHLSSTMGKGVPVEVATVDPSSPRFMLIDEDTETAVKKALEAERAKESPRQEEGGVGGEQISM